VKAAVAPLVPSGAIGDGLPQALLHEFQGNPLPKMYLQGVLHIEYGHEPGAAFIHTVPYKMRQAGPDDLSDHGAAHILIERQVFLLLEGGDVVEQVCRGCDIAAPQCQPELHRCDFPDFRSHIVWAAEQREELLSLFCQQVSRNGEGSQESKLSWRDRDAPSLPRYRKGCDGLGNPPKRKVDQCSERQNIARGGGHRRACRDVHRCGGGRSVRPGLRGSASGRKITCGNSEARGRCGTGEIREQLSISRSILRLLYELRQKVFVGAEI
jgi:hypothetical protein